MYQRKKSHNTNHNSNSSDTHSNTNNNNNNDINNKNNHHSSMYSRNGASDIEGGRLRVNNNNNNNNGHYRSGDTTNANILEQQNNERMNELANHVALLKGLTIEIGNEVREQNSLLDQMNDGFTNTRDMLQTSLRRIGSMLEQGGTKHMCYMVLFCVAVMMLLWWLMSSSSS